MLVDQAAGATAPPVTGRLRILLILSGDPTIEREPDHHAALCSSCDSPHPGGSAAIPLCACSCARLHPKHNNAEAAPGVSRGGTAGRTTSTRSPPRGSSASRCRPSDRLLMAPSTRTAPTPSRRRRASAGVSGPTNAAISRYCLATAPGLITKLRFPRPADRQHATALESSWSGPPVDAAEAALGQLLRVVLVQLGRERTLWIAPPVRVVQTTKKLLRPGRPPGVPHQ